MLSSSENMTTNIKILQAGCPSCRPANNFKVLKGNTIVVSMKSIFLMQKVFLKSQSASNYFSLLITFNVL